MPSRSLSFVSMNKSWAVAGNFWGWAEFHDYYNLNEKEAIGEYKLPILAKIYVSGLKHYNRLNDYI
jgi:hypothetical protein